MKTLAELSGYASMFETRKLSFNQHRPKRHNITLDGSEMASQVTSQKNRTKPLLLADAQRLERNNSFQNFVLTCKNGDKKHVHFEDQQIADKPQLTIKGGYKRTDCNLFSQIRDSKQHPPVNFEDMDFKLLPSNLRERSLSNKQLPNGNGIEYRIQQERIEKEEAKKHTEKFECEMETDSELLLKQSVQSISREDEQQIRGQMNAVKERALTRLSEQIQVPEVNLEELMSKLRKEVSREVDAIIDKTLANRKSLYKVAQRQIKEYFLRVDSKKKSPGSGKTYEETPCFDEARSFSKSGRRTGERNTNPTKHSETNVSAFDILSSNKQHNSISRMSKEHLIPSLESVRLSEKRNPDTRDQYRTNSSNCSKQSESSRFTFTVSSKRKSEKTTKRIKDRIISGARNAPADTDEVIVKQFNV